MKKSLLLTFICLGLIMPIKSHADLPADAQDSIKKGVIAAKEGDYQLATRYFQDARKIAPDAPEVYFNLGLAESKIPGRELRAIAWFGAYLSATPNAPNASAVKDQMQALDIKSQSNLSHLIQTAQDTAVKIPITADAWPLSGSSHHDQALAEVAHLWASSGDLAAARNAISLMPAATDPFNVKESTETNVEDDQAQNVMDEADVGNIEGAQRDAKLVAANFLDRVNSKIARAQAKVGKNADAFSTADQIQNASDKHEAYGYIADAQAMAGDTTAALKTIALDPQLSNKNSTYNEIVLAQLKANDITGALTTANLINDTSANYSYEDKAYNEIAEAQIKINDFNGAAKSAASIGDVVSQSILMSEIATAMAKSGDITGAQKIIDTFHAKSVKDEDYVNDYKCSAQLAVVEAQEKINDIPGAKKTLAEAQSSADHITTSYKKDSHEIGITTGLAKAGDFAQAFKTSRLIQDPSYKSAALEAIAEAQAKSGDMKSALKTADILQNGTNANGKKLAMPTVVKGQAEAGDIAGALKTANTITDISSKSSALYYVTDVQAGKGDIAGAQNTADQIQDSERKDDAMFSITEAQIKAKDYTNAQKSADQIQNDYYKNLELTAIAKAQTKPDSTPTQPLIQYTILPIPVSDWIKVLDDETKGDYSPLNTPPFLDLAGLLKNQPPSDDTQTTFDSLKEILWDLLKGQNAVDQMLKQQMKK